MLSVIVFPQVLHTPFLLPATVQVGSLVVVYVYSCFVLPLVQPQILHTCQWFVPSVATHVLVCGVTSVVAEHLLHFFQWLSSSNPLKVLLKSCPNGITLNGNNIDAD